jgi:hypothetical protein
MAVRETTRSWSGSTNPAWGLTTKVGPWKETPADLQKFNSRAGGPHAGHGNWMQSFNPHPYIQTMPTPGLPNYVTSDVVMPEDFDVPRGLKIPGLNKAGSKGITGKAGKLVDNLQSNYGLRGSDPQNGAQGNGLENLKEPKKSDNAFPNRVLSKQMYTSPLEMDLDFTSNPRNSDTSMRTNTSERLRRLRRHSDILYPDIITTAIEPRQRGYGLRSGSSTDYSHHNGPGGINI